MKQFAEWLSTTFLSVFIQNHNSWVIPTIQSIHIVGIAVVLGSVFMIDLRILGWAGMDQTLRQTTSRFAPWVTAALCLLLATGILMVIGEPVRELVTFSFWLKMFLVAVSTVIATLFQLSPSKTRAPLGRNPRQAQIHSGAGDTDVPDLGVHYCPGTPDRL